MCGKITTTVITVHTMEKAAQLGMLKAMWANRMVSLANKVTEKLEGHFFWGRHQNVVDTYMQLEPSLAL